MPFQPGCLRFRFSLKVRYPARKIIPRVKVQSFIKAQDAVPQPTEEARFAGQFLCVQRFYI
jgi:hypothetical protein